MFKACCAFSKTNESRCLKDYLRGTVYDRWIAICFMDSIKFSGFNVLFRINVIYRTVMVTWYNLLRKAPNFWITLMSNKVHEPLDSNLAISSVKGGFTVGFHSFFVLNLLSYCS